MSFKNRKTGLWKTHYLSPSPSLHLPSGPTQHSLSFFSLFAWNLLAIVLSF